MHPYPSVGIGASYPLEAIGVGEVGLSGLEVLSLPENKWLKDRFAKYGAGDQRSRFAWMVIACSRSPVGSHAFPSGCMDAVEPIMLEPNGVNVRPEDPFWASTPARKKLHDRLMPLLPKVPVQVTTTFDPIGAISKIPVLGDIVHIVGEAAAAPFNLVSSIASGERLDHALLGALKDQIKIVKDVAPYVQTVISFVPGIGTGVAAAIGAGAALVEGKSIDEALKAGIKGALPGGPLAAAAFDAAMGAMRGENIVKATLESARNLVPDGPARKAFDIGVAVATGEKLQTALVKGLASIAPGQLQTILSAGQKALSSTPGLSDALKLVPVGEAQKGFQIAAGLLGQTGMNEKALAAVRKQLPSIVQQGFDAALKSQAQHIPWVANVANTTIVPAVVQEHELTQDQLDLQALAKLSPAEQKQLVDMQALSNLTPEQQKQLVDYANAKNATPKPHEPPAKPAATPKPHEPPAKKPSTVVTSAATPAPAMATRAAPAPGGPHYGPYPHGSPGLSGPPPSCSALGPPISVMSPGMRRAGSSAVNGSGGRPRMVHSPDGIDYLFMIENGVLTARECLH